MLRSLHLLPVYDSAEYDLVRDLQVPLLKNSTSYLRGVGYFTSGWLRIASQGVVRFVENGGKARVVLSPILEPDDWKALQLGDCARLDSSIRTMLSGRVRDLSLSLERDTLNALAWMVCDGVLEIRFAIPRELHWSSVYHDKVAVFSDGNGDGIALHGSLNDSVQGSLNGEAFSVFKSWEPAQCPYFEKHSSRLEMLWADQNPQFRVFDIPEVAREQLIELRTSATRPYSLPQSATARSSSCPHCTVRLHPFQEEAVRLWQAANCRGVLEMATGTGKTITALAAAVSEYRRNGRLALIITVPYLHLLEQWEGRCQDFGFRPVLCSGQHPRWPAQLASKIQDFTIGAISHISVVTVHATAASSRFVDALRPLPLASVMYVGDEVHALGAPHLREALAVQAHRRLGLSATPKRWFDPEGTGVIFSYFGNTCFEFTLDDAIGRRYLTPYRYYPVLVALSCKEEAAYRALTVKISAATRAVNRDPRSTEQLRRLFVRRARILASASAKLPALSRELKLYMERCYALAEPVSGILVYCAPGTHKAVLKLVSGLGLRCHEFVHYVSLQDRESILNQFSSGEIQALVAVRCLDEGVDIPSTKAAFILASSTNPREFVQRRGRILRQAPDKELSTIYDCLVVPSEQDTAIGAAVLRRELPRFVEFASSALNEFEARSRIRPIVDRYQLLHLLDHKPWEVYHSVRERDWEAESGEEA